MSSNTAVEPGPGSTSTRMKIASADSRGDPFPRPGAPRDSSTASGRNSRTSSSTAVNPGPSSIDVGNIEVNTDEGKVALDVRAKK